ACDPERRARRRLAAEAAAAAGGRVAACLGDGIRKARAAEAAGQNDPDGRSRPCSSVLRGCDVTDPFDRRRALSNPYDRILSGHVDHERRDALEAEQIADGAAATRALRRRLNAILAEQHALPL